MIMKNTLIMFGSALAIFASNCAFGQLPAYKWTATVNVVGQSGSPVTNANVAVSYTILPPPLDPNQKSYGEIKGTTDAKGCFSASHTDSSWNFGISIEKAGYYTTHIAHELYQPGQMDDNTVAENRNLAITLKLKTIGTPIAMYAKRLNTHVPDLNKPVGFDLEMGDWVTPYGKGKNADLFFTRHFYKSADGESDNTLTVSFPKAGDGIQEFSVPELEEGSALRSPHEAPSDRYQSQWVQTDIRKPGRPIETNRDKNRNYFFRVRTKLDDNDRVVSARYGKIYGDFMEFSYYLNPTINDRNVEFDPKRNLLAGLKVGEGVSAP